MVVADSTLPATVEEKRGISESERAQVKRAAHAGSSFQERSVDTRSDVVEKTTKKRKESCGENPEEKTAVWGQRHGTIRVRADSLNTRISLLDVDGGCGNGTLFLILILSTRRLLFG